MAYSKRFPQLLIPTICVTDVAQVAGTMIKEYEYDFYTITNLAKTLAPGDPVRILLLRMAARESQYRVLLNYGFQQNFILSSVGANLDAIGSNYGSLGARLPASPAVTTIQFSLAAPIFSDIVIPAGTTISGSSLTTNITFQTTATVTLAAQTLSVNAPAQCTQSGAIGNGFTPGQLNAIGNWQLPYITTATNTTTTQGGADIESDDAYAMRLALVPGAFSVAGSYQAYQFWTYTANVAVSSVSAVGPAGDINQTPPVTPAGYVDIYIMLQGGQVPDSSVLAQVQQFLRADVLRPMGDVVTVKAPSVVNYNIVGTYWIDPVNQAFIPQIQAAVQAVLPQFNNLTSSDIGRMINPEHLGQMLMEAGASDYQLTQPVRTILNASQVGVQSGTMNLAYGGLLPE